MVADSQPRGNTHIRPVAPPPVMHPFPFVPAFQYLGRPGEEPVLEIFEHARTAFYIRPQDLAWPEGLPTPGTWSIYLRRTFGPSSLAPYRLFDGIDVPTSCWRWKFASLPRTRRTTFATFYPPPDANVQQAFPSPAEWFADTLRGKDCLAIVGVHDPPREESVDGDLVPTFDMFSDGSPSVRYRSPSNVSEKHDGLELNFGDVQIDEARSTAARSTAARSTVASSSIVHPPSAVASDVVPAGETTKLRWEVCEYSFDLTRGNGESLYDPLPATTSIGSMYFVAEDLIDSCDIPLRLLRARTDLARFHGPEPSLMGVLVPRTPSPAVTKEGMLQSLLSYIWDKFLLLVVPLEDEKHWEAQGDPARLRFLTYVNMIINVIASHSFILMCCSAGSPST